MKKLTIFFLLILFVLTAYAADNQESPMITLTVNNTTFTAILEDNSSAQAFAKLLQKGPLTLTLSDYGNFEKVGSLGTTLPRNDTQITTVPGDIILYQGNQITIYYDKNTWSFTRLGKIQGVTQAQLKSVLGTGDVTVRFEL